MTATWIWDLENDRWRTVSAVAVVLVMAWGVAAWRDGDWAWSVFCAIVLVELLRKVLTGALVSDDAATWISGLWVRRAQLGEIEAVEVARPGHRFVFVRLWIGGRGFNVRDMWNWTSPVDARDFGVRLVAELQRRGAVAGMYDAVEDEWPITPATRTTP